MAANYVKAVVGTGLIPFTTEKFDGMCQDFNLKPWQIASISVGSYVVLRCVYETLADEVPLTTRVKTFIFKNARKIPFVKRKVDEEVASTRAGFEKSLWVKPDGYECKFALPDDPLTDVEMNKQLLALQTLKDPDQRLSEGRVSGTIYVGGENYEKLTSLLTRVYGMFAWTNPLHAAVFPGIRTMEAEVVEMTLELFHGKCAPSACGMMTSGGTESILMALKAYRDYGREVLGIKNPNIVVPRTAHPAFQKGGHYFGIHLRVVEEDQTSWRANVEAMRRKIDRNTVAIVGSCPQYPHGVVDPIQALSDIAVKYKVGLHIDCCLGSFLNPFMKAAGFDFPKFDFELPGVTSISCDTHKYGFAPKGTSVIMFSNMELRKHAFYSYANWPGGLYGTPSIAGSRSGALVATTWAAMVSKGKSGYVQDVKAIIDAARKLGAGIEAIPGLKLLAKPESSVVCWASDDFDINRMAPILQEEKGWDINVLQFPSAIHIAVTMAHTPAGVIESLLKDMAEITAEIMKDPKQAPTGAAAIYGTSQAIPDRNLIADMVNVFIESQLALGKK